jgi:hypothetical protein
MMVLTERLTPETFLSSPRRGVIAPNSNGTLGLYSVSTHEFGKGTKKEWRVMDLATGSSFQLTEDEKIHDVKWLPGSHDTLIWLRSAEHGITELSIIHLPGRDGRVAVTAYVGTIEAPVEGLKVKALDQLSFAVAVVGLADNDGRLYNEEDPKNKQLSTARIYDDINVREVRDGQLQPS